MSGAPTLVGAPSLLQGYRRVLIIIESLPLCRDHRARKQVLALLSHGYEVVVICQKDSGNFNYRNVPKLRLYEYRPPPNLSGKASFAVEYGYSLVAAARLAISAWARPGFDVIQVCDPPDTQFLLALPFKLLGRRLVVDQRDLSPEVYASRYGRDEGALYWLLKLLERLSWRFADHVVCVNRSLQQVIVERGLIPGQAVAVVGNGPSAERVFRRRARPELKQAKAHLACWIGLMGPQDNVDVALKAIRFFTHELNRRDCLFAFIGSGESLAAMRQLAGALGISEWVTFTGWLDEEEVFEYLSTADVGFDSNLQEEVSPVKGMEYMAFGLAFAAFDLKETRVMADDAAAYAEPGNARSLALAIADLLDDAARRAEMGRCGRERFVGALAWEHQQARYLDVYEGLFRGGVATAAGPGSDPRMTRRLRHRLTRRGTSVSS